MILLGLILMIFVQFYDTSLFLPLCFVFSPFIEQRIINCLDGMKNIKSSSERDGIARVVRPEKGRTIKVGKETHQADPLMKDEMQKSWGATGMNLVITARLLVFSIPLAYWFLARSLALFSPLARSPRWRSPMISGYQNAAVGVFGFIYAIMDLNLGDTLDSVHPEYLIKDPRKAMLCCFLHKIPDVVRWLIQIAP